MKLKLRHRFLELLHEKEKRENRRIKHVEIANATGISAHTIGNWLKKDVGKFEAHVLEGLCEYFQCGIADLLYFEEVEKP